jgi:hypothetical protein
MAITRIWHGWTTRENADVYENLLRTDVFPGSPGVLAVRDLDHLAV